MFQDFPQEVRIETHKREAQRIEHAGWKIRLFPAWLMWLLGSKLPRGLTAPWRRIYLAPGVTDVQRGPLLAHEGMHVYQGLLVGPWKWALKYLLFPSFRRTEEVLAEAAETAVRGFIAGAPMDGLHGHYTSTTLGGWKWPHFTGGDPDRLRRTVIGLASKIYVQKFPICSLCGRFDRKEILIDTFTHGCTGSAPGVD